jgi:hypothetical protein
LTGYVDDADIELAKRVSKPLRDRPIDIGYRAADLPPQFGRFGRQKADIARHAVSRLSHSGLKLDISTAPEAMIQGDLWFDFLGNCRFTLGCESGSSILDPDGRIGDCAASYRKLKPTSTFEEVEQNCFPGQDGLAFPEHRVFSTISPRIFEAGLGGTAQILIEGKYEGVLEPWTHYVPVDATLSDASALVDIVRDTGRAEEMASACRVRLLSLPRLTYRRLVEDVLEEVRKSRPALATDPAAHASRADGRSAPELHAAAWRAYLASVETSSAARTPIVRAMGKFNRAARLLIAYTIDFEHEAKGKGLSAPLRWVSAAWQAAATIIALRSKRGRR